VPKGRIDTMSDFSERQTPSGIRLPAWAEIPPGFSASGERPGVFPFTRGIHPSMYRGRLWTMRQYSGFGTARETNRRLRFLLEQGQSGLSIAFDLPTQIGYDSDATEAAGEVGKVGVPISTLEDLEALLDGIPLDAVSISMTINSSAAVLLALLVVLARRRGLDPALLRGTLQNDILKEFAARHTQRFPLDPSMRLAIDVIEHAAVELPLWNPISVSGYHIREAGATAVEEVAITLAHACAYLEGARARGLDLAGICRRLSFFFNAQMHLFEEVAKFRAARRLWARIVRERFGVQDDDAARLRFHAQTAGAALTYQEPENNSARITVQALAAVLGGAQSLHTNGWDEALGLPSEASARAALRTQQILAYETGAADVADPLGGAPLIEMLTDEIEAGARRLIDDIDARGGAVRAIKERLIQRWIESSSYRYQRAVESGARVVVGVNRFRSSEAPPPPEVFRVDDRIEKERVDELRARKAARDRGAVAPALARIRDAARGSENLMPLLIRAVERGATLGEMMGALAEAFGEYQGDL
jgi:methylmalonyl-CoA mutase N-terminal domain/subunit